MWPPLLLTLILTRYACAQGNDSIATITAVASTGFTAYTLGSFTYVWDGENGHDKSSTFLLNNITLELMSGKAEDNGDDVADIIGGNGLDSPIFASIFAVVNTPQSAGNHLSYQFHPATPAGDYYVRMNGTIWSGTTTLSTTTARSNTFSVNTSTDYPCSTPPWTPVRSVTDPGYSPLRITTPMGGDVEYQTNLNNDFSNLDIEFTVVDELFDSANMKMTLEFVSSDTGFSPGFITIPADDTNQLDFTYPTGNITLAPGGWKIRSNFTSTSPRNPGSFVAMSDEFYVALEAPCAGLTVTNSTSSTSSASPGPTAGSQGGSSSKKNSGGRIRALPLMSWALGACMSMGLWMI